MNLELLRIHASFMNTQNMDFQLLHTSTSTGYSYETLDYTNIWYLEHWLNTNRIWSFKLWLVPSTRTSWITAASWGLRMLTTLHCTRAQHSRVFNTGMLQKSQRFWFSTFLKSDSQTLLSDSRAQFSGCESLWFRTMPCLRSLQLKSPKDWNGSSREQRPKCCPGW